MYKDTLFWIILCFFLAAAGFYATVKWADQRTYQSEQGEAP